MDQTVTGLRCQILAFLFKCLLLLALVLLFNTVIRSQFLHFSWGNALIAKKVDYLQDRKDYNMLVIGSSYIYRHFIPSHFDMLTDSNSFNLGAPGIRFMEGSYLLDKLLDDSDRYLSSVENILFLAQVNLTIPDNHLHTDRGVYWMDLSRFISGVKYFYNDLNELRKYFISFFQNVFLYRVRSNLIGMFYYEDDIVFDFQKTSGYKNLDDESGQEFRNIHFRKNYTKEYRPGYDYAYTEELGEEPVSNVELYYESTVKSLEARCAEKGIKLHLIFTANDVQHRRLNLDNIIYMGDGSEIPELFRVSNYFDKWHLNTQGAELFTDRLALVYNRNSENLKRIDE